MTPTNLSLKSFFLLISVALAGCNGESADTDPGTAQITPLVDKSNVVMTPVELQGEVIVNGVGLVDDHGPDPAGGLPVVSPAASGPAGITDLVLVTGQSNALGALTSYDPVLDSPVDRFYAFTDQGWQRASLKQVWDLGWHPRNHPDTDPSNNFGFHFGKTMAQLSGDRVVGIILATAPGEGIQHWDRNGSFYPQIRNKVLSALNALPHKSGIDGILWHQGETDWSFIGSNDPDLEVFPHDNYYTDKLWEMIGNFRAESWFSHDRPFICGETSRSPVNDRLNGLNRDTDPWTACVPGEGLATYDEIDVHFNAASLRQLGANYAQVYWQMTGSW